MTLRQIPLEQILPNPFQTRQAEDPEHVAKVADSIAASGLLQTPVARQAARVGLVELAFGHTRLAAFRVLSVGAALEGKPDPRLFDTMPVDVRELSDIEMFELAVRENIDRRDLTPIEEARAMATYRDSFGKTSAEIGVLFGIGDSAVRNKMRLLDLPAQVQEKIKSGELGEGVARRLLALQHIAPNRIQEVAKQILEDPDRSGGMFDEDPIADVLYQEALQMSRHGNNAGDGLWPLAWKGGVARPTGEAVAEILAERGWKVPAADIEGALQAFASGSDVEEVQRLFEMALEAASWIRQLVAPPPCTACEFHQVHNGTHFCGIEACYEQKKKAWLEGEIRRAVKRLGVQIYDPPKDGSAHLDATFVWKGTGGRQLDPAWQKLLDKKDPSLRLRAVDPNYSEFIGTGSHSVELIRVGEAAKNAAVSRHKESVSTSSRTYAQQERRRRATDRFVDANVPQAFGMAFSSITSLPLLELINKAISADWGKLPAGKVQRMARLRERIALRAIKESLGYASRGPKATAKELRIQAKQLGVKLPKDWDQKAAACEPGKE